MKLNGVPVKVTTFFGNLYGITILPCKNGHLESEAKELAQILTEKCGCSPCANNPSCVLAEVELRRLPAGRSFVCTGDTYTHILPLHTKFS